MSRQKQYIQNLASNMSSLQEALLSALKNPSLIRFKDGRLDKAVPRHFYVALPVDRETCLLLCMITSKVEKRFDYARRMKIVDGLVRVSKHDISCLSMDSVIDCNHTSLVSKDVHNRVWLVPGTFEMHGGISDAVRDRVYTAIRKSAVVPDAIKQMLPRC